MEPTKVHGNVALVTGANRGIGLALAEALVERGAEKIYASVRNLGTVADLRQRHSDLVVLPAGQGCGERLGHDNAAFTVDTYQHVLPGMQAEAAQVFENLIAPEASTG